jgi:hypothetical protein
MRVRDVTVETSRVTDMQSREAGPCLTWRFRMECAPLEEWERKLESRAYDGREPLSCISSLLSRKSAPKESDASSSH